MKTISAVKVLNICNELQQYNYSCFVTMADSSQQLDGGRNALKDQILRKAVEQNKKTVRTQTRLI